MSAAAAGLETSMTIRAAMRPNTDRGIVGPLRSHIHLQRRNESLLRDVDLAVLAHLLLAFLLLLQKLSLARHVAAVALRRHVPAQRAHGFARADLAADRGLGRPLEHVRRDQLFELLHHGAAAAFRARVRCTSMASASTGSPLTKICILT